ncbi:MAG: ribosomal protein S18-alanine N-acetyltransferase [Polyangia bacterium]
MTILGQPEPASAFWVAEAGEADIDAIMEIDRLSFASPWLRQAFADELDRPWAHLDVLREGEDGRVIGFCDYWLVADELHLLNIAVHPDRRGQGGASQLVGHVVAVAREHAVRLLALEVRVSNRAARSLYQKFGFREVGTRPQYYANNHEDAVLMDLLLTP